MSLGLSVLLSMLSQAPAAPAPMKSTASVEGVHEYVLPNGLKVLLVPDDSNQKVTVNLTVLVGGRHEGYGEKGMAHLLEHMLFKGTPAHKDPKKEMTARGAEWNGTTSEDRTNYYETLPASDDNTDWAIRFEADRLMNCFVSGEDLKTEMTVVRNEFERSENNGPRVLYQRLRGTALQWHNYGRAVIGIRADIERVPVSNLKTFYQKYYQPDNAILIVAGRFNAPKALASINASFGKIPKPKRQLPATFTEEPTQDGEREVAVRRVGGNPLLSMAWRIAAATDPDFAALAVLQGVVGDEPQGRMHQALVNGKKTSSVRCDLDMLKEPGLFTCLSVLGGKDSLEASRLGMIAVLDDMAKVPATQAEVNRARDGWVQQLENTIAESQNLALNLSEWAGLGDWRMLFVFRDRLKAVTAADVNRVAAKYFKAQNRSVGQYIPTEKPDRVDVANAPDILPIVSSYKGGEAVARGEAFDPSPSNIDTRTKYSALSNGVKVGLLPKKTRAETVVATLRFHFGTAESLKNTQALQILGAAWLERGTKKLSFSDFRSKLEQLKASIAVTSEPQTITLNVNVKRPQLAETMELVNDMLKEPALDGKEFQLIKKRYLAGFESQKGEPSVVGAIAAERALSPFAKGHPRYVASIEESAADFNAATEEQVRSFLSRFLATQNAEIVLIGDFDDKEMAQWLQNKLGTVNSKEPYALLVDAYAPSKPGNESISTPDKAMAFMATGVNLKLSQDSADFPALMLANIALGGTPGARLFAEIRDRLGLSYGTYSNLQVSPSQVGERAGLRTTAIFAPQNAAKVEAAMRGEMSKWVEKGLTESELNEQRKGYLDSAQQDRGDDRTLSNTLSRRMQFGRTMAWDQKMEESVKKLTVSQINEAIKRNIDLGNLYVVKAGDFKTVSMPK